MIRPASNKLSLVAAHTLPWHCRDHCSNEDDVTNDEDHITNRKASSDDRADTSCFCVFIWFFGVNAWIVAIHFHCFVTQNKSDNSASQAYDPVAPAKYDGANSQYKNANVTWKILLHSHRVSTHRILLVRVLLIRISLWWRWRERRILIFHI